MAKKNIGVRTRRQIMLSLPPETISALESAAYRGKLFATLSGTKRGNISRLLDHVAVYLDQMSDEQIRAFVGAPTIEEIVGQTQEKEIAGK